MKIIELTLHENKRLILNQINHFKASFSSLYQILIGTNGSGKSTIMRELSPLPASSNDYIKGGYKEILIEHDSSLFKIRSEFDGSQKHFFIKGEEELNPGHTVSVQKALVKEHFGYSSDSFEIIAGIRSFTNMGPQDRRELILKMMGGDLNYAMRVFQRTKGRYRDTQAVIKHLKTRLANEIGKRLDAVKLSELKASREMLLSELNTLLELRAPVANTSTMIDKEIRELQTLITAQSRAVVTLVSKWTLPLGVDSKEDLETMVINSERMIYTEEALLRETQLEYSKWLSITESMGNSKAENLEDLKAAIDSLELEINGTIDSVQYGPFTNPRALALNAQNDYPLFEEIIVNIPINDGRFNHSSLNDSTIELMTLKNQRHYEENKLNDTKSRLSKAENEKSIECPQCKYEFIPGHSHLDLESLKASSITLRTKLEALDTQISDKSARVEECAIYSNCLKRYSQFVNSHSLMSPIWERAIADEIIFKNPKSLLRDYREWIEDATKWGVIEEKKEELNRLKAAYSMLSETDRDALSPEFHLQDAQSKVELHTEALVKAKEALKELKVKEDIFNKLLRGKDAIIENMNKLMSLLNAYKEVTKNETFNVIIKGHQIELARVESVINESILSSRTIKEIEDSIVIEETDREWWSKLATSLSPTEGIIAEQIKGFVDSFISQMNDIISANWTYPLSIKPCIHSDGELDYVFPLSVMEDTLIVPDIALGSSAQVDIVNFAFRLVYMFYLGLSDSPLYLDELAPTFDEEHRVKLTRFVSELIERRYSSQVFIISHYHAMHGAFSNAEICVTDPRNIVNLPPVYNRHVQFAEY